MPTDDPGLRAAARAVSSAGKDLGAQEASDGCRRTGWNPAVNHRGWLCNARSWLLFLGTPFVMLLWLAPFVGSRTIGNDYPRFGIDDQLELMWSIRKGTFPLYLPGFAMGHSSAAATLGQLYHPISWLAVAMPGYWNGLALEWNTFLRLLSLGIAHLVLYRLARGLRVARLPSFVSTFAAVYNLRMLDSFRYGPALEGYVAMLLVAAAAGFVYLNDHARWPVACLGASTYLLLVSGHPQWMCFGALGATVFGLLFPWTAQALDAARPRPNLLGIKRYATRLALGAAGGGLLAAPCLLTFYFECYRTNDARVGRGYPWTLELADTSAGELGNFLFPLHADVHGAFAGSALFLLAAFFPVAALVRRGAPLALWGLYGSGVLAFLFALGAATGLHPLLVEIVPPLGSFRVPGRMVLLIPLASFPLSAWMMGAANRTALAGAGVSALLFYGWSWLNGFPRLPSGRASPVEILGQQMPSYVENVVLHLSGATLLCLVLVAVLPRGRRLALACAGLGIVGTTWLCLQHGTWQTERSATRTFEEITAARRASLRTPLDPGLGMEMRTITAYSALGLNPRRPFATVAHAAEQVRSEREALARLASQGRPPLLVEAPLPALSPEVVAQYDEVRLIDNTYNRYVFDVAAGKDGYVVLGLPWLPGFVGHVDGVPATVVKANALYPALFVPRGRHVVEFRFVSRPFLVGLGAAMLGTTLGMLWLAPSRRVAWVVATLLVAALAAWMNGALFHGPSLGNQYRWRSEAFHAGRESP